MANTERKRQRRKKDSAHLVWDSKPRRAPNPRDIEFQTAEVVIPNPARDNARLPLSFRDGLFGDEDLDKQRMNRLIWGDNLLAMQALLAQGYEGKINLIYIDPPFASGDDYSHKLTIEESKVVKEPSAIQRLAYKDTWTGGIDSYLDMLYPRLQLMKRFLADDGSIYVHLDWHLGHYVKVIMDEVFGKDNLVNEIIWKYHAGTTPQKGLGKKHDNILFYRKSDNVRFNLWREPIPEERIKDYRYTDENGRRYRLGGSNDATRYYLDEGKAATDVWTDINIINKAANERTGFQTQKPARLLERIVEQSTNSGDLVADFFAGSGTTLEVAEKLGRRWIGCELGKVGIQITRTRLVEADAKPFLIENIGNYQREMIYLAGGRIGEMQQVILRLYGATPRPGGNDLGTRRTPDDQTLELVYVGYPDRPVSAKKAEELARQAETLDGTGYKRLVILAWDYEYNYSTALDNRRKTAENWPKVEIESRSIPPDIYDYLKKAKSEEDIEPLRDKVVFHEKPYLRLADPQVEQNGDGTATVTIGLDKYVIFDIPVRKQKDREDLQAIAKDNFAVLIDYWAVDWDYDGFTFKSQWQALRGNGRKVRVVPITTTHTLPAGQDHTIAVRVVDIFGNDAAGTMEVGL